MSNLIELARKLRPYIEQASASLPDKDATACAELFPTLHGTGKSIPAGTRINWGGVVKKAAATCWDRQDNDPDHAPTLWKDLPYRDGYRISPETITVTEAFDQGERGWWGDVLYESKAPSNVYTPDQYANNWKEVTP